MTTRDTEANGAVPEQGTVLTDILTRSTSDMAFRQRLMSEPKATLEEALGYTLPDGFSIQIAENRQADLSIVLPDLVTSEETLSDEDLEAVAGGICLISCAASCAVTSTDGLGVPMVGGVACL